MNQFHDILTGTSIGVVFEDAAKDYARIEEIAGRVAGGGGQRCCPRGRSGWCSTARNCRACAT
jgi:alpha-mannosidase